ncbi:MAG: hypothetical protein EP297_00210 [Gammaproteobacteria bacterium]|nr:MAG: hypothetical protein EP297_00210 [Gammaproteobacteria bacterium]
MADQVERVLRKDQLSQNQANHQQCRYEFILHDYVDLDALQTRNLKPSSTEKLAHGQRDFYIDAKLL